MAAGWHHVAATNVMVWHRAGASFGSDRDALVAAAQQTLERLHPGYAASIQRFIARDPMRPVREALDIARIRDDPRYKVLRVGSRASSSSDEALVLGVIPEIWPFNRHWRVCASAPLSAPNLPRIPTDASVGDWTRTMRDLDVRELHVQPSMARTSTARRMRQAARDARVRET
jgi:hypothetical protein